MEGSNRSARLRLLLVVLAIAFVVGGCKSAFRAQVETVAANIGRDADDVEHAFQRMLPHASEAELETAASRSARDTAWIKSLGQRFAAEWEQQATLRSIAGSTCEYLGLFQQLGDAVTQQQVVNVVRNHIKAQGLAPTDAKVLQILEGILKQINSLINSGTVDIDDAIQNLACLPF